jgi:hypothetical protein
VKLDLARTIGPWRALDHTFAVRAPEPLRSVFEECFADLPAGDRAGGDPDVVAVTAVAGERWDVHVEGDPPSGGPAGWVVAHVLEIVNQRAAASLATEIPLHAATVIIDGVALAAAGASGSGKSTLAAAAVLEGHQLVADEVSAVTPDLQVRPYHGPVGLRRGGAAALGVSIPSAPDDRFDRVYPWRVAAHATATGPALSEGGSLAGIVLVSRQPGPPATEEVTPV